MKKVIVLIIIMGLSKIVMAENKTTVIETDSYSINFPATWKLVEISPRAVVEGPKGEIVEFSSFSIQGNGKESKKFSIQTALRENLLKTLNTFDSTSDVEARTELQKYNSPGSQEFYQRLFQSKDNKTAIGLFGLINGNVALLVSIDVPVKEHDSLLFLAERLDQIKWKKQ